MAEEKEEKNVNRFQVGSLTDNEAIAIVRAKEKMMRSIYHDTVPSDKALLMCVVGFYNKGDK